MGKEISLFTFAKRCKKWKQTFLFLAVLMLTVGLSAQELLNDTPGADSVAVDSWEVDSSGGDMPTVTCNPVEVPFVCDFDADSATAWNQRGVLPDCWQWIGNGTDTAYAPHVSVDFAIQNASLLMLSGDSALFGTDHYVILPYLSNSLNDLELDFMYKTERAGVGVFSYGYVHPVGDTLQFVPLDTLLSSGFATAHTQNLQDVAIPDSARLAFCWHNTDSAAYCILDRVRIDSLDLCVAPKNLTAAFTSDTSAFLSWERGWGEHAWVVEYGPADFVHGSGSMVYATQPSLELTDLTANSQYDFRVYSMCGENELSDSVVARIQTPCATAQLPYHEDFEAYPATSYGVAGTVPPCWTAISNASVQYAPHVTYAPNASYEQYVCHGQSLQMTSGSSYPRNFVVLPWFDSDLNGTEISFSYKVQYIASAVLTLGYLTNVTDPNSFVVLETIPTVDANLRDFSTSLYNRSIPRNARLAFQWYNSFAWGSFSASVDDIAIEFLPCQPVTNVNVSDVMMTTATVSWNRGDLEQEWLVEYGETGFAHGEGDTTIITSDTTLELTDLVGGRTYDVYVQALCDRANPSPYSDVVTFTPYCSVYGDTAVVVSCDSFSWLGKVYTESGLYIDTLPQAAAYSCDSIVTLDLSINPSYNQFDTLVVCENELPYRWRDIDFGVASVDSDFVFNRVSIDNCDSTVHLHLIVHPSYYLTETAAICQQDLSPYYVWRDTTFGPGTETGVYVFNRTTQFGCDSIVTLNLTVNESKYETEVLKICADELPYTWRDTTFGTGTASEVFTFNRQTRFGCDSIVTLALIVNPVYNEEVTLELCRADLPYTWRNITFGLDAQSNVFQYRLQTTKGCDSTVTLNLVVNEATDSEETLDLCESEFPYAWRDTIFQAGTQSGDYELVRLNASGCESTAQLHLNVHSADYQELSQSVCSNDLPLAILDTTFEEGTTTGVYRFVKQNIHGCDSITVLNLTVNQPNSIEETVHICRSELPYDWRDTTFQVGTRDGVYTLHRTTQAGCDSVLALNLFVHESFGSTEYLTVCEDELPMVWRGNIIPRGSVTGTYNFPETTVFGCDSIVILRLTVNPKYNQTEELTICENELPYTWRDTTFQVGTRGGTFLFNRLSQTGCDSLVALKLTVNPSFEFDEYLTLCENELPYRWRDTTFNVNSVSGRYVFNRQTTLGCDSIVNLTLVIHPSYNQEESLALCANELPFVWRDVLLPVGTESGDIELRRRTVHGCDSVVTLHLMVYSQPVQTKEIEICDSELPYEMVDTTFGTDTRTGNYQVTYHTAFCDSIVNIHLTVHPTFHQTISEIICANELPFTWRDTTFGVGTQSGVYQFVGSTQYGCDSIVNLALIVHPSYDLEEEVSVCENGFPFTWRDTVFRVGTTAGDYVFNRYTIHGCDSVVTLHLTINPIYNLHESLSVCQNDLPYTWRDTTFEVGSFSGFYTFYRSTVNGCDSVVSLTLNILPSYSRTVDLQLCANELPYQWEDTTFDVGSTTGRFTFHHTSISGCDSVIILNLTVNQNYDIHRQLTICSDELPYYYEPEDHTFALGTVSNDYVFSHYSQTGCDSIVTLSLTVNPSYHLSETVQICENELPFTWRDTTFQIGSISNTFVFHRQTQSGCDSVVTLTLSVNPLPHVSITGDTTINEGETTILFASYGQGFAYVWNTGMEGNVISVSPDSTTTYTVTVTSAAGCSSEASVTVHVSGVGIPDFAEQGKMILLYPNPTDGQAIIRSENGLISEISIFDLAGKLIRNSIVHAYQTEIDLSSVAPATYLVQIKLETGEKFVRKLIVK